MVLGRASWAGATAMLFVSCSAVAAPAPTLVEVKAAIEKTKPGSSFEWKSVQLAAGRRASAGEASAAGLPFPVTIYPARVAFTFKAGFKRDVTWNYYIYRDDFGAWTAASNATPGNVESQPY